MMLFCLTQNLIQCNQDSQSEDNPTQIIYASNNESSTMEKAGKALAIGLVSASSGIIVYNNFFPKPEKELPPPVIAPPQPEPKKEKEKKEKEQKPEQDKILHHTINEILINKKKLDQTKIEEKIRSDLYGDRINEIKVMMPNKNYEKEEKSLSNFLKECAEIDNASVFLDGLLFYKVRNIIEKLNSLSIKFYQNKSNNTYANEVSTFSSSPPGTPVPTGLVATSNEITDLLTELYSLKGVHLEAYTSIIQKPFTPTKENCDKLASLVSEHCLINRISSDIFWKDLDNHLKTLDTKYENMKKEKDNFKLQIDQLLTRYNQNFYLPQIKGKKTFLDHIKKIEPQLKLIEYDNKINNKFVATDSLIPNRKRILEDYCHENYNTEKNHQMKESIGQIIELITSKITIDMPQDNADSPVSQDVDISKMRGLIGDALKKKKNEWIVASSDPVKTIMEKFLGNEQICKYLENFQLLYYYNENYTAIKDKSMTSAKFSMRDISYITQVAVDPSKQDQKHVPYTPEPKLISLLEDVINLYEETRKLSYLDPVIK